MFSSHWSSRVFGHMRLDEQGGLLGIDAGRQETNGHVAGALGQGVRAHTSR